MHSYRSTCPIPSRLSPVSAVALSLFSSVGAWAAQPAPGDATVASVEFNDAFLHEQGGTRLDVSRFNQGNAAAPGIYRVDLYVNEVWTGRSQAVLRQVGSGDVQPCFDRAMLEHIGVDVDKLSQEATALLADNAGTACAPLPKLIPDATAVFDNGEQRLDISVPQIAMSRAARGYVDPRYWDDGVPAARVQYNANAYRSDGAGVSYTQAYVGLNAGVNIGPWRFHHDGSLVYSDHAGTQYQALQTNMQRSIAPLKSQLIIGDAFTDGSMFDSFGVRGVQLASDDRMYPESQRGYAPTIHGIANSNARVQIRQNGNIIYETTVSPGAFEINDLYPTGYGGDLEVIVTEADGSQRISRVPYAPMVNALRPGTTRFNVTVGQYRSPSVQIAPGVFQATVQHGFNNLLTGYGGVLLAQNYASALVGVALNTTYGAFGLDITHATTGLTNEPSRNGQSIRISYSKLVAPTSTNLTLAAYRYSTRGFLGLSDAMALKDLDRQGLGFAMGGTVRGRLQVMVNQALPAGYGSFYLSGSTQDYWNRDGRDTQFQAGYSNSYRNINFGISASRQLDINSARWDNRVMLTLSVPLGKTPYAPYASTSLTKDSSGAVSLQESVSGSLGTDNAFSYSASAGYSGGGGMRGSTSAGLGATYISSAATLTGNVSKGSNYSQVGAGMSGGVVAYPGGVAFMSSMGDTLAVVEAKDAAGARVLNGNGLHVDRWGHAVVSNLTPFSRNEIEIDPKGLPLDVELKSTIQNVAPTAGAVVKVKFETDNPGRAALLQIRMPDGKPLPFGAEVMDPAGQIVGTVAQAGRIVVRGLKSDSGTLTAKWGAGANETCTLGYALPKLADAKSRLIVRVPAECRFEQMAKATF